MNVTLYIPDTHRKKYRTVKEHISPSLLFQYALDAYCKGSSIEEAVEVMQTHNEKVLIDKLNKIRKISKIKEPPK